MYKPILCGAEILCTTTGATQTYISVLFGGDESSKVEDSKGKLIDFSFALEETFIQFFL
jgi:hypothetical protein